MNKLRLAGAGSAAAVAVALLAVPVAAHAAPPLGITSVKIATTGHGARAETHAVVRGVCPVDPPTTLFVAGVVGGVSQLLGSEPVTCDRTRQRFVLPFNVVLPDGTVVTNVFTSISGDGGEVDSHLDSLVVQ